MIQEIKLISNGKLIYVICFNIIVPFHILR